MGRKGFHGNGTVLTKHTGAKDIGGKGMAKFKGETKQKASSIERTYAGIFVDTICSTQCNPANIPKAILKTMR